jgi:hypothetical protein
MLEAMVADQDVFHLVNLRRPQRYRRGHGRAVFGGAGVGVESRARSGRAAARASCIGRRRLTIPGSDSVIDDMGGRGWTPRRPPFTCWR